MSYSSTVSTSSHAVSTGSFSELADCPATQCPFESNDSDRARVLRDALRQIFEPLTLKAAIILQDADPLAIPSDQLLGKVFDFSSVDSQHTLQMSPSARERFGPYAATLTLVPSFMTVTFPFPAKSFQDAPKIERKSPDLHVQVGEYGRQYALSILLVTQFCVTTLSQELQSEFDLIWRNHCSLLRIGTYQKSPEATLCEGICTLAESIALLTHYKIANYELGEIFRAICGSTVVESLAGAPVALNAQLARGGFVPEKTLEILPGGKAVASQELSLIFKSAPRTRDLSVGATGLGCPVMDSIGALKVPFLRHLLKIYSGIEL